MIEELLIAKKYNTYSDIFLTVGLALLVEQVQQATYQSGKIQLVDAGTHYCLQFETSLDLNLVKEIQYTKPFPQIIKLEESGELPADGVFDLTWQKKIRKAYKDYRFQRGVTDSEQIIEAPPRPDSRVQVAMALAALQHNRKHNQILAAGETIKECYGQFLAALFEAFSQLHPDKIDSDVEETAELFYQATKRKLPPQMSAIKIYLPTATFGANQLKSDGNDFKSQKTDWLTLWLIAGGLFETAIADSLKISERSYAQHLIGLAPINISFAHYKSLISKLRQQFIPTSSGKARYNIDLIIALERATIELKEKKAVEINCGGLMGVQFVPKGQSYGIRQFFNLARPAWLAETKFAPAEWQNLLKQHSMVVATVASEPGNELLLANYENFMSSSNLQQFWRFQIEYAGYLSRISETRISNLFNKQGLDLMAQEPMISQIVKDSSFLRIARAINNSTVYAGKVQTKNGMQQLDWERNYGLAQRLGSQIGSKVNFAIELANFLTSYEAENLKLRDRGIQRVWPTKKDLDRLIELIDEFNSNIVGSLLLAYGHSQWFYEEVPKTGGVSIPPSGENGTESQVILVQD